MNMPTVVHFQEELNRDHQDKSEIWGYWIVVAQRNIDWEKRTREDVLL